MLVETLQAEMADNFVRKPLQVWNFGHVVDERPACQAIWTAGTNAGNGDQIKNGMKACGDTAAYAAADNPNVGQIATGLILLLAGVVLLGFAAYLGLKVIKAAMEAVYHGIRVIFGFAAGGFIYGPTQTALIRDVVDSFIAAGRMAVFTGYLGIDMLILGDLFRQAKGQVMAVLVMATIVQIIAVVQLRNLSHSLDGANDWVANQVALATQNAGTRGGSGGGGGRALGMGQVGVNHTMSAMAMLGGLSTIANSPLPEWIAAGTPGWLHPQSRMKKKKEKAQGDFWTDPELAAGYSQSYSSRITFSRMAKKAAMSYGEIHISAPAPLHGQSSTMVEP
ncbi:hypothetical protein ACIBG0_38380 [Nocardia sp. NPDC050630]|uniref:hypothetical protein n=1 Tax=Nocardia sp. NPDC050630 TaxID=3364321 RepID=UPI0037BABFD7